MRQYHFINLLCHFLQYRERYLSESDWEGSFGLANGVDGMVAADGDEIGGTVPCYLV